MMDNGIDLRKIKLVIWDLDECFWKGTLSEEAVAIEEANKLFVHELNNHGIVNSICSKNEFENVKTRLQSEGLWDEFVFPSINWNPKGARIKQIIENMNLRAINTLFIDDNTSNLNEAKSVSPELNVSLPDVIPELVKQLEKIPYEKEKRKRLSQYRVLQTKIENAVKYDSNLDFLKQSEIHIRIRQNCHDEFERVYEIIHRTNQLNFTKIRSSEDEIKSLLDSDDYKCGLVEAHDKYGDYGTIGFYCLDKKNHALIHYCFSCRTLGMGIEQYVYQLLEYPRINVVEPVASKLSKNSIDYITVIKEEDFISQNIYNEQYKSKLHILFKGPCDLEQLFAYISKTPNIETEFVYQSNKIGSVQQYNHTWNIINTLDKVDYSKEMLVEEEMLHTHLFAEELDMIFLSIIPDAGLGVYKNKKTGVHIVFGDHNNDLTDELIWDDIIHGKFYNAGFSFTKKFLQQFKDIYEYEGLISPEQFQINLDRIIKSIGKNVQIYIMSGVEMDYLKNQFPAYEGRHLVHFEFNKRLKVLESKYENVHIFDINEYVKDQSCFTNCINHWNRNTYYSIAQGMKTLLESKGISVSIMNLTIKERIKTFFSRYRRNR